MRLVSSYYYNYWHLYVAATRFQYLITRHMFNNEIYRLPLTLSDHNRPSGVLGANSRPTCSDWHTHHSHPSLGRSLAGLYNLSFVFDYHFLDSRASEDLYQFCALLMFLFQPSVYVKHINKVHNNKKATMTNGLSALPESFPSFLLPANVISSIRENTIPKMNTLFEIIMVVVAFTTVSTYFSELSIHSRDFSSYPWIQALRQQ